MDPELQAAFIKVGEHCDDHGYEIFAESLWYVFEGMGGERG